MGPSIRNNLNALKQTSPSNVSYTPILFLQLQQTASHLLATLRCTFTYVVSLDDFQHFVAYCSSQGVVEMGCKPQESRFFASSLDLDSSTD
jgi:hypothetical protein